MLHTTGIYPFAYPINMPLFSPISLSSAQTTKNRSVTNFLLNTEIVPLCLRIMENGCLAPGSAWGVAMKKPGNLSTGSCGNLAMPSGND